MGKKRRIKVWEGSKDTVTSKVARKAILIKFGKREHLEQLVNGDFRFSPLSKFKSYEKKGGINDPNEGTTIQEHTDLTMIPQTGKRIEIKNATFSTSTNWIQERGIFCLSAPDLIAERVEKEGTVFRIDMDYIERMQSEFKGCDTIAVFDRKAVEEGLDSYSNRVNIQVWHDEISYLSQKERNEKAYEISKSVVIPGFVKDIEMSYQNEYRIMLDSKLEEPTFIKIDELSKKCELFPIKNLGDFALFVDVQRDF